MKNTTALIIILLFSFSANAIDMIDAMWNPTNPHYYTIGPGAQSNHESRPRLPLTEEELAQQEINRQNALRNLGIIAIIIPALLVLTAVYQRISYNREIKAYNRERTLRDQGGVYCSNCKSYAGVKTDSSVQGNNYSISYSCQSCYHQGVHFS